MDDLTISKTIAASAMKAQAQRLRVISENLANADSLAKTPGGQPYRRKTVSFKNELDRQSGVELVKVGKVSRDAGDLERKYDPHHVAADKDGYVLLPNVNPLIEMMDMKEAQRAYDANLNMMRTAREMSSAALDILK